MFSGFSYSASYSAVTVVTPPLATPLQTGLLKLTSMLSKVLQNHEQMRLNFGKKFKTASLNSRFTDFKKEECTLTCSLLKHFET